MGGASGMENKICGTCKWHYQCADFPEDFICVCGKSDYCTDWTGYNDTCDEWEGKE